MGKLILVTGGARSGKSSFAERTAQKTGGDVLYIATAIPFDEEMEHRIEKHRERRPGNWQTIEAFKSFEEKLEGQLHGKTAVMLDCVTVMLSNLMFEANVDCDSITNEQVSSIENNMLTEIDDLLGVADSSEIPFLIVTNEIGMGIVPENRMARIFRDIAGRVNQRIAERADEVYFCVSGIPVKIK